MMRIGDFVSRKMARLSAVGRIAGGLAVGGLASTAMAQTSPPTMPEITYPVDPTSVVTAVVAAGGALLLLWFGPSVAFSFAKGLLSKLKRVAR